MNINNGGIIDVANGQFCYGQCLIDGIGVAQDTQEGIKWMTLGAEHGDNSALITLGNMHMNGIYMPKNEKKGFSIMRDAALRGLALAMDSVGACYATGRGVEKSLTEARKWFEKAIKAGYHESHRNLALLEDMEANESNLNPAGFTDGMVDPSNTNT